MVQIQHAQPLRRQAQRAPSTALPQTRPSAVLCDRTSLCLNKAGHEAGREPGRGSVRERRPTNQEARAQAWGAGFIPSPGCTGGS